MTSLIPVRGDLVISELLALLVETDFNQARLEPETVHRIRVGIKKTRAWLKLCGSFTDLAGDDQQLKTQLRRLSDYLAQQRDRDVASLTLLKLARKYPGKKLQQRMATLSTVLREHALSHPAITHDLVDIVASLREGLAGYQQPEVPRELARAMIADTHKKMCTRGRSALKSAGCEELHAWRRRVKTLGYQMAIAEMHQGEQAKLFSQMTRLGTKLGRIHDLCFLQTMIESLATGENSDDNMKPLFKRIQRERDSLLKVIHKHYRSVCRDAAMALQNP